MDRSQFDKIVDYRKLSGQDELINEVIYQLFCDNNDPFVSIQGIDSELVPRKLEAGKSLNINGNTITTLSNYKKAVCFGSLLRHKKLSDNKINRMWYKIAVVDQMISRAIAESWIHIGNRFKFTPSSFESIYSDLNDRHVLTVINNVREIPASIFYLGIAFLRCLREKPPLVVAGVHLIEEVGLDPYVAFAFLHKYCAISVGHMPIDISRGYGEKVSKDSIEKITIPAACIIGLRRLIFSNTHGSTMSSARSFSCADSIGQIGPRSFEPINLSVYDTLDPMFMKILECAPGSKDEEEAIVEYKKYYLSKKGRPNAERTYSTWS